MAKKQKKKRKGSAGVSRLGPFEVRQIVAYAAEGYSLRNIAGKN